MARRPTVDYIVFATRMREQIQKENPEASFPRIQMLVIEKWCSIKDAHQLQCASDIPILDCFFCNALLFPQAQAQAQAQAQVRFFLRQQRRQQQNSIAFQDNDDHHDVAWARGSGGVSDENTLQDRIAVGLVGAGAGEGEEKKALGAAEKEIEIVGEEEEEQNVEEQKKCKICFGAEQKIVFVPCGHLCTCEPCANKVKICPICRKGITMRVPVFYS